MDTLPSSHHCRRVAGAAPALLLALFARDARAQSVGVEVFAAQQPALSASSLWGGALTVGEALAVRVGGAVGYPGGSSSGTLPAGAVSAYAADLDLMLAPGAASRPRAYGIVGAGLLGRREHVDVWERGATLSAGGGVMVPVLEVLTVDVSTRYRIPAADSTGFRGAFPRGWEYRAGIALRFGGSPGTPARRSSSRGTSWPAGGGTVFGGSGRGTARAARVLSTAEDYLGVPYRWGGEDPATGFDCSGFTQYVFRQHGVRLPRTSREQVHAGQRLPADVRALAPGDLIFFAADGQRIDHVAIYAGDYRIIHATASGNEVRYDDLRSQRGRWFVDHMVAARRVLDDGGRVMPWLERTLTIAPAMFDSGDRAPRP